MFPIFSSHLQEFQLKYSQCLVLQVFCFITFMQPKLFQFKRWLAFGALFGFSKCSCSCFFLMICAVRSYAWKFNKNIFVVCWNPFSCVKSMYSFHYFTTHVNLVRSWLLFCVIVFKCNRFSVPQGQRLWKSCF